MSKFTSTSRSKSVTSPIWLIIAALVLGLVDFARCQDHSDPVENTEPYCQPEDQGNCINAVDGDITTKTKKTTLSELFDIVCNHSGLARCVVEDLDFDNERRIIKAKRDIPKHGLLIGISDEIQMTKLEALRDPRVKSIMDSYPLVATTGKYPPSDAYLAIYLVLEKTRFRTGGEENNWSTKDKVRRAYVNYLPTMEDILQYHPVAKRVFDALDADKKKDKQSTTYTPFVDQGTDNVARTIMYQYKAFSQASENFINLVSFEDYVWAKLIVESRQFSRVLTEDDIDDDELKLYLPYLSDTHRSLLGGGLRPLFDSFNDHHKRFNLGWMDDFKGPDGTEQSQRVIYAVDDIKSGTELFVSYHDFMSDVVKFNIYGYINTDGSDNSIASIAPYHNPQVRVAEFEKSSYVEIQKEQMRKYLNFMDGYESCPEVDVEEDGMVERAPGKEDKLFQYARMKALKGIFNKEDFWGMTMPNNMKGPVTEVTDQIMTTCRILATTHRDYDGMAMPLLGKQALTGTQPVLKPSGDDSLEYRAHHVLERLATEVTFELRKALTKLIEDSSIDGEGIEKEVKRQLGSNELDSFSMEGMRAYIIINEIDLLRSVIELARDKKEFYLAEKQKKLENGEEVNEEDYLVRTTPCPGAPTPFDWNQLPA